MAGKTLSGGDKLEQYLDGLAKDLAEPKTVHVGFLEGARYPDGTPVAMIAAIQNFGAPAKGIPPRPFFSNMIAKHKDEWGPQVASLLQRTGGDAARALSLMGLIIEGQLREEIVATGAPPNSPVTNLLKHRFPMGGQTFEDVMQARRDVADGMTAPAGKPLVHTGDMLNSIGSEVE